MRAKSLVSILLLLGACLSFGCKKKEIPQKAPTGKAGTQKKASELSGDLVIFHAGSLSVPFKEVSEAFMKKHPKVSVQAEAAGTRDCARKVSELGRHCDVFGAADYRVVENLLMPEFADFNIRFVTNEMAIAYVESSKKANEITAENWHEILLQEDVAFGRADPNSDPCGYRSVMVFQLAETAFGVPGLAEKLATKDGKKYIRPKETDLLALLEAGEIDYLFIYRSVAEQHGLKFLALPDAVNLRSQEMEDLYATATIEVTGKKPGEMITRKGSAIVYSVAIPIDADRPDLGRKYLAFLLSSEGQAIMEKNGHPVIRPPKTHEYDKLPEALTQVCEAEDRP